MRMWMLACGAVTLAGFLAVPVSAQEPIALPQSVASSAQPVTMVQQQRGLFGRVRSRREVVMYYPPMTTTTTGSMTAKTMTSSGTTTASGTGTTPSGVQQAQFTQPGTSSSMQMGAMGTQAPVMETVVVERRQGLLARLRARR